jgi:hypothetical protein
MKLAAANGRIAVVPAAFVRNDDCCPQLAVAANGPVQIYRVAQKAGVLLTSVAPGGVVKAIALSTQLAVLTQRANASNVIERFNPGDGKLLGTTSVSSSMPAELDSSSAGIVYRVGTKIFLIDRGGVSRLVWNARARPIGLSIEGWRIAWAENVNRRGRIVALTLPR